MPGYRGDDDRALADWLRGRKREDTAFLLAIDQFEELFTFAEPEERARFDRLLATALGDADCPLFVISTVRADFLDRFDDLPALVEVRNRMGRPWTLPAVGGDGLREIIGGPAQLAGLNVSEVQEAMVADARDEPGALPLVENALHWLWQQREANRLSGRLFTEAGGLAGILSQGADDLLSGLGKTRKQALELLFRLVNVDPESRRHTRRRIPLAEAVETTGGGQVGQALIDRLAGQRDQDHGSAQQTLRLITITEDSAAGSEPDVDETGADEPENGERWVNLIHETLIRSGPEGPYWPALWDYIEQNKHRAARRERLRLQAREWDEARGFGRVLGLDGWASVFEFRGFAGRGTVEARYLQWSRARLAVLFLAVVAIVGDSVVWLGRYKQPVEALSTRWAHWLGFSPTFPELVEIPAGKFSMGSKQGSDDERPVHEVVIAAPFYLSTTEITFEEYDAFSEATGRDLARDQEWGREKRPVINVSWDDAQAYVQWLDAMTGSDCRLPGEAQWEYAARAGTETDYALRYSAGEDWGTDDLTGLANCRGCGPPAALAEGVVLDSISDLIGNQSIPVASFGPNEWGLYDMHGNVWEWVQDCFVDVEDDSACWIRVLRGGSWYDFRVDARSALRYNNDPYGRHDFIGFRVLCSSPIP